MNTPLILKASQPINDFILLNCFLGEDSIFTLFCLLPLLWHGTQSRCLLATTSNGNSFLTSLSSLLHSTLLTPSSFLQLLLLGVQDIFHPALHLTSLIIPSRSLQCTPFLLFALNFTYSAIFLGSSSYFPRHFDSISYTYLTSNLSSPPLQHWSQRRMVYRKTNT